jgi:acetyl-CoA carboxylase beta subunit
LNETGSYLEAMRHCTVTQRPINAAELLEEAKNAAELEKAKNAAKFKKTKKAAQLEKAKNEAKLRKENLYEKWDANWEECMEEQLTENDNISPNQARQGEMRTRKLVELFKDSEKLKQLASDTNNSKLQKLLECLLGEEPENRDMGLRKV